MQRDIGLNEEWDVDVVFQVHSTLPEEPYFPLKKGVEHPKACLLDVYNDAL